MQFQSTLPREERLYFFSKAPSTSIISIHAPTRGATVPAQNPFQLQQISIHAPTRGATMWRDKYISRFVISIHAPTRGATNWRVMYPITIEFQSTLPREERLPCLQQLLLKSQISIHAPTRGATAILHKKFVYFYTIPTINI